MIKRYEFGQRLKAARLAQGLTQQQLAQKLNTYISFISAWETGARPIKRNMIKPLSDALNIPLEDFLF